MQLCMFWNDISGKMGPLKRASQKEVDKDGTLDFLLKHTGRLIAFERVGRASASPNASVNWVGKWRRLLSALGMEARVVKSFALEGSRPSLCFRPTPLTSRPPLVSNASVLSHTPFILRKAQTQFLSFSLHLFALCMWSILFLHLWIRIKDC